MESERVLIDLMHHFVTKTRSDLVTTT